MLPERKKTQNLQKNFHVCLKRSRPSGLDSIPQFQPLKKIKFNLPHEKSIRSSKQTKNGSKVFIKDINYLFDKDKIIAWKKLNDFQRSSVEARYFREKQVLRESYLRNSVLSSKKYR